jgi:hypothetical protein
LILSVESRTPALRSIRRLQLLFQRVPGHFGAVALFRVRFLFGSRFNEPAISRAHGTQRPRNSPEICRHLRIPISMAIFSSPFFPPCCGAIRTSASGVKQEARVFDPSQPSFHQNVPNPHLPKLGTLMRRQSTGPTLDRANRRRHPPREGEV